MQKFLETTPDLCPLCTILEISQAVSGLGLLLLLFELVIYLKKPEVTWEHFHMWRSILSAGLINNRWSWWRKLPLTWVGIGLKPLTGYMPYLEQ